MFRKKPHPSPTDAKATEEQVDSGRLAGFSYLKPTDIYLDAACQSLRPQPVVNALNDYFTTYNACGGRVKYAWGQKVDEAVETTRRAVLKYLGLSPKDYVCAFTLNTTYGLNLILSQLPTSRYQRIVTSDIEHNSVFLSTITTASRLGIPRLVLERTADGSLDYAPDQITRALIVVNTVSNIDGRPLNNLPELVRDAHDHGSRIIIDAAQTMAHHADLLQGVPADAICFSAHKMYGASLGGIIIRRDFLSELDISFIGGGTVTSVTADRYALLPDDPASWLEPGLQAYGEIIALGAALRWLKALRLPDPTRPGRTTSPHDYLHTLSRKLYDGLTALPDLRLINTTPTPVISVYPTDPHDAHRLAAFLSAAGIMTRSGYFCCHYYLKEKRQLPPLLRFSLGLHTTVSDIDTTLDTLAKLTKG